MNRNIFKLSVLVLAHLVVDFYGGLLLPLPEPTLTLHYGVSLGWIMLMVSSTAILVNLIQPIAAVLLPRRNLPVILIACPMLAAAVSLLGITDTYWIAWTFLAISGIGIGVLHPEAALMAQSLSGNKLGLVTSIFMSGGFFGFSLGSLIAGWWAPRFGLDHFWLLAMPGAAVLILVFASGLPKSHLQHESRQSAGSCGEGEYPFGHVLAIGVMMATNLAVIFRLLPIYFVREFGAESQTHAGIALFLVGLGGAGGSFLWGHLADRYGICKIIAFVYFIGFLPAYFLLNVKSSSAGLLWASVFGVTIGGTFPLSVALARKARSFSPRMRLGLCIGGAWGTGELSVILATLHIDRFPPGAPEPVHSMLQISLILIAMVLLMNMRLIWRKDSPEEKWHPQPEG